MGRFHCIAIVTPFQDSLSPAAVSSRISQLLAIQAEAIPEAWGGEEEPARILRGLELVRKMDEAFMFCQPVDLEQVPSYCTLVPFPTDLSTITERLRNGLYRWVGGGGEREEGKEKGGWWGGELERIKC